MCVYTQISVFWGCTIGFSSRYGIDSVLLSCPQKNKWSCIPVGEPELKTLLCRDYEHEAFAAQMCIAVKTLGLDFWGSFVAFKKSQACTQRFWFWSWWQTLVKHHWFEQILDFCQYQWDKNQALCVHKVAKMPFYCFYICPMSLGFWYIEHQAMNFLFQKLY